MANDLTDLLNYDITLLEGVTTPIYVDGLNLTTLENIKKYLYNNSYNVKDFGAKGDDKTDDTDAIKYVIELAFQNKKNVYFPQGTYKISDTINLQSNTLIHGEGVSSCIKMYNDDETAYKYIFTICNAHDISIVNLKIDGNAQNTIPVYPHKISGAYHGIFLLERESYNEANYDKHNIYNINIKNCYFTNCYNCSISSSRYSEAIVLYIKSIVIDNCYFYNNGAHGVGMNFFKDSIVTNCIFDCCGQTPLNDNKSSGGGLGVDVSGGCENIIISNNIVKGTPGGFKAQSRILTNGKLLLTKNINFNNNICRDMMLADNFNIFYGIKLDGENIKCTNNHFDTTSGKGILIDVHSRKCIVANNTIEYQIGDGITVNAQVDYDNAGHNSYVGTETVKGNHIVSNNILRGGDGNGIVLYCDNNIIESNNVSNFTHSGIRVVQGSYNLIKNNIIYDNQDCGINTTAYNGVIYNSLILDSNMCFSTDTNNAVQKHGINVCSVNKDNIKLINNNCFNNYKSDINPINTRQFNDNYFKREINCECYQDNFGYYKILTNLSATVFSLELTFNFYDGKRGPQKLLINGYCSDTGFYNLTYDFLNNNSLFPNVYLQMEDNKLVIYVETVHKHTSLFAKLIPIGHTDLLRNNINTYITGYELTNIIEETNIQRKISPTIHSGTTEIRNNTVGTYIGYEFYDTTENKMYYWNNGWF